MSLANEKIVLTLRGDFSKDPLLYNLCMVKIWSIIINLKFGRSADKDLLEYLDKIDNAISEIQDDVLELMLKRPEKLSN